MSGTSCDGISAALVQFGRRRLRVLAQRTTPYPAHLIRLLRRGASLSAAELSTLNMALGQQLARAALTLLRAARVAQHRVTVIGSHGHTIYHGPNDPIPSTLQIGEPSVIAQRTGIPVVADFRMRDLAAGGEGAPLVPYFDEAFFGGGPVRALQNLGGIANVTVVGRGIPTLAFDTGPGNTLMDLVVQRMSRGRMRYDAQGHLALRGRIDDRAIERLWAHPYFQKRPPKSTGAELFNEAFLIAAFGRRLTSSPLDVLATVTYFTAFSIVESLRRVVPRRVNPVPRFHSGTPAWYGVEEMIVSGGGVRNRTLMRHLARLLAPVPVHSIERYGIPPQAKEPAAFAFLALQALRGRVNHLPSTTGARTSCVLGSITPAPRPSPLAPSCQ